MRALVLDDSLTVRMDLVEALQREGLEAIASASIAEARLQLASGGFDLVLLDVVLPDGDGVAFLKELRGRPEQARAVVMMLSSEAEVRDRVRGLGHGADEYVGKPYDLAYVLGRARALLRRGGPVVPGEQALVLLIEDSATFREVVTKRLTEARYRVLAAENGEAGLSLAAPHRPAAIIVDGVLPDTDGAALIRRIRLDAALQSTPCLMLTGSMGKGAELEALQAGADDFVRKAEDPQVLLVRLEVLLRKRVQTVAALETESLASPKKVLAVDDSATYLHAIVEALSGAGCEVVTALSGEDALDLVEVQKVDCILLDVELPGLDGREVCRRIKADPTTRDIPLILVTADVSREAMSAGLSAGADDFFVKSGELQVLRARVLAQLRRKQIDDQRRHVAEELLRRELEAADARAEKELAQAKASLVAELERKNRELEAFSYSVSHDLRAPLRSIIGFTHALVEDSGHLLDDVGRGHVARVQRAGARMIQLIDDLLQLSRIGRGDLQRRTVDMSAIALSIVQDLEAREPARKVVVEVAEGLVAAADQQLVRVLLENVLGNAWKFTGKTPSPQIAFGAEQTPSGRAFVVRDNGAGFDSSKASKLFAPFQRMHSADDFPGTGIGLATVQRVVDRHGGQVWVESERGKGTSVFFTLEPAQLP